MTYRESFDLLSKQGIKNSFRRKFDNWCRKFIIEDTIKRRINI